MTDFTEEKLAADFAKGKTEALEELIKRCQSDLFGFLLGMTGRKDIADDLFQETFLKFVRRPQLYKEGFKFRAWIFTVAKNAAYDYFRREKTHNSISLSGSFEDGSSDSEGAVVLGLSGLENDRPDKRLENEMLGENIRAALLSVSPEQREVFYLRHYSGLSFKEIAALLNEPIGTVLARMSRATAALRKELVDKE